MALMFYICFRYIVEDSADNDNGNKVFIIAFYGFLYCFYDIILLFIVYLIMFVTII